MSSKVPAALSRLSLNVVATGSPAALVMCRPGHS